MAFGAKYIFPIDQQPGTAVGISVPFNAPGTFYSTYTTKDAIKNNLINYLLIDPSECYLNNPLGAGLRKFIFEHITSDNLDALKSNLQSLINQYFVNVIVDNINILQYPDTNEIEIQLYYSIGNTGITDQIEITIA